MKGIFNYIILIFALIFTECDDRTRNAPATLFRKVDNDKAGIDFINQLDQTEELNTYTFRNFYNGAGVGVGDINNDGFVDLYFCGNTRANKLYLNKGDFIFEDITEPAGVACTNVWSTGVSMVDINADGFLDIYVCKSGQINSENRHNELFINNGDLTFTEQSSEYGLDIVGLAIHATFFDYDRDGDLDCYLLNNSINSTETFEPEKDLRTIFDEYGANMLLRNDNLHFANVTKESGIYSSRIGFGLGATVSDLNKDGWPDLYISNDFFEKDYLYLNNQDGTFSEVVEDQINEISMGAMGADIADINNDGYPEIYVTEMTAEDNARRKTKTVYQSWDNYQKNYHSGYYHQFARNTLQLNNGNNTFSEIGRFAGVDNTDWSWGALIFDINHDGFKDIFVANGIYKDLLDRDYLEFYANPRNVRNVFNESDEGIISLIDKIPSVKVSNYAFINNKGLTFTNLSKKLGLDEPSFSNGAAYADFDNDGDLDIVVNNINHPPFIYENRSESSTINNYLTVILTGDLNNPQAIGSKVTLVCDTNTYYQELIPIRGFLSTVDSRLNFGLGNVEVVDSVIVNWPDGRKSIIRSVNANQFLRIDKSTSFLDADIRKQDIKPLLSAYTSPQLPEAVHIENEFNDFERYNLLFHMRSNEGPHVCVGDINSDGKDDFYVCGARDVPGKLFIQTESGFLPSNELLFHNERLSEETDCELFDADNDGDLDLYVACGSLEFPSSSTALIDKLYLNNGKGIFTKSSQILPSFTFESTSCVRSSDFDLDGDLDLFIGVRMRPFAYGVPPQSYLLQNDGNGLFKDITKSAAPALFDIGHVTDANWADIDEDGDDDLIAIGEWMPVTLLLNDGKMLRSSTTSTGLEDTHGLWHVLKAADLDNDGDIDFVAGNHGTNSRLRASKQFPVEMWVNDFDLNGSIEQIITTYQNGVSYPLAMKPDLIRQMPTLASKITTFADYKELTLDSIFDQSTLKKSIVHRAYSLESSVILNLGEGRFEILPLQSNAQFSPVYGIMLNDMNNDGFVDILLGGNLMRAKPEVGIYNASYGLLLANNGGKNFVALKPSESGICIKGEIRDLGIFNFGDKEIIIVAKNNSSIQYLKKNK